MMIRLLLCSLAIGLVGLASGCDSSTALQPIWDDDGDSTYTPVQIEGTIGFLTDELDGQRLSSSWVRMDLRTGVVQSRTSLDSMVSNPDDPPPVKYPIRVAESPDGMRLATVTNDCAICPGHMEGLYVSGANASAPLRIFQESSLQPVSWSPDNQRLLFANAKVAELTDTDTLAGPPICVWCKAFPNASPDVYLGIRGVWGEDSNTLFLFVPTEPEASVPGVNLYEVDLRSPDSPRRLTSTPIFGLFSREPGGEHVIARLWDARFELVNLGTSESRSFALPVTEGLEVWVRSMLWNPEGRFFFVHYTQALPGDRYNVQSTHIGIIDTEDPDLRWQPLPEVLPFVIPENASVTLFTVRNSGA